MQIEDRFLKAARSLSNSIMDFDLAGIEGGCNTDVVVLKALK